MLSNKDKVVILMADDDHDDYCLTKDALHKARVANRLIHVEDGEQLMHYLKREGIYQDEEKYPLPGLLFLDLNMPLKSGREALMEIKNLPHLKHLPIIILTTSSADEDILITYNLGSNSYIRKPVTFDGLVEVMEGLKKFWLEIVELPPVA